LRSHSPEGRSRKRARAAAAPIAAIVILSVAPLSEAAASRDLDRDGLSNRYELKRSHTQPRRSDTDGDKLRDGFEVRRSHTDPRLNDTDADGLRDGYEVRRSKTSPLRKDTDRDGTSDGLELLSGTDPLTRGKKKGQPLAPPDSTPPDTTITSGPSGSVATSEVTFEFSSSEAGASFECRLDGAAWARCASPRTQSRLANGSHTFDVRATDAAANVDPSPATRTWIVAVTASPEPPTASFTWSPQNPQNPPVQVAFTSNGACAATPCTYEWRHGPPGSEPIGTGPTSSWTYQATGTKTVVLRVTDALGRYAEATNSFTVSSSPASPASCSNSQDDDGDGKTDYPADPGCTDSTDTDETDPAPPPPPPPPSSTCSAQPFCGDFETGNYSQYDQHQWSEGPWADQSTYTINNVGHSECDIVPSPVRQGSFASRCQVKPTTGTSASDRAEMMSSNANATGDASQTQFYGWWTMFPSVNGQPQHWWPTFADHNDFFQFGQNSSAVSPDGNTPGWHYCGVNATQSPARLYCEGPGFPFSSTSQRRKIDLGAIQYDHWYHFVVEARWSQDPSVGYLSLWVDGVNVSPKRSAATLTGTATQVHVSWGLYRAAYSSTNTVIHDGLCRAATYQGAAGC
jgi:Polysaccharide lyase/Bacterial TSP3 repeat